MKEQKYILKNQDSFELKDIFECGQCFRWNKQQDGSYTGVFKGNVLNVKKENEVINFSGLIEGDIKEVVTDYFDLNRDYTKIKDKLSKIDIYLEESIKYGSGIRLLNQDLYGNKIEWKGNFFYTFPTPKQLESVTAQDFRNLGLGFRDIRLYETTHTILNNQLDLEKIHNDDTITAREKLLSLSGVGPKVADCILLFSTLKRFDVFPIDVWVRRVMNELYIKNEDENKVNKKEIMKLAKEKFGNLEGLAQQYLFYWKREA